MQQEQQHEALRQQLAQHIERQRQKSQQQQQKQEVVDLTCDAVGSDNGSGNVQKITPVTHVTQVKPSAQPPSSSNLNNPAMTAFMDQVKAALRVTSINTTTNSNGDGNSNGSVTGSDATGGEGVVLPPGAAAATVAPQAVAGVRATAPPAALAGDVVDTFLQMGNSEPALSPASAAVAAAPEVAAVAKVADTMELAPGAHPLLSSTAGQVPTGAPAGVVTAAAAADEDVEMSSGALDTAATAAAHVLMALGGGGSRKRSRADYCDDM